MLKKINKNKYNNRKNQMNTLIDNSITKSIPIIIDKINNIISTTYEDEKINTIKDNSLSKLTYNNVNYRIKIFKSIFDNTIVKKLGEELYQYSKK